MDPFETLRIPFRDEGEHEAMSIRIDRRHQEVLHEVQGRGHAGGPRGRHGRSRTARRGGRGNQGRSTRVRHVWRIWRRPMHRVRRNGKGNQDRRRKGRREENQGGFLRRAAQTGRRVPRVRWSGTGALQSVWWNGIRSQAVTRRSEIEKKKATRGPRRRTRLVEHAAGSPLPMAGRVEGSRARRLPSDASRTRLGTRVVASSPIRGKRGKCAQERVEDTVGSRSDRPNLSCNKKKERKGARTSLSNATWSTCSMRSHEEENGRFRSSPRSTAWTSFASRRGEADVHGKPRRTRPARRHVVATWLTSSRRACRVRLRSRACVSLPRACGSFPGPNIPRATPNALARFQTSKARLVLLGRTCLPR